jgi:uncharacterized repeat protein (TIGR01451 family)
VLAPVGSEVVLKASICTPEGYTLANQKVEWMLGRNGVGQFVELGGKGVFHPPVIPWNRGEKVDNYLANGYTADGPLCIDRGTADPTDDVNINRGDAWISVSSPNEGTSHVTAYTPAVESWDLRKAAATIYWVDVQWTFPPPALSSSGRDETLTTVVTRQTDGTPLEGWIVRYEVADGSAGAIPEVRTGPDGRASVQVSPAGGAASSQINVQLVRPANFAGSDAPPLVISSGTTHISWGGGSQPYLPPSTSQPLPTTPPMQTSPGVPVQQDPITPPPSLPATARARLELSIQGAPQATVGGQAGIRITIRNMGDAAATNVVLKDAFDAGLSFPAKPRSAEIEKPIAPIAPGGVYEENLNFDVTKAGQLCHKVSVSYAEGAAVSRSHCLTATEAAPQREGGMRVSIDGPLQGIQGQTMLFKVTVKNVGQTALVNIVTEEEYPPVLRPQPSEPNVEVISGKITRQIPVLEIGQQEEFLTSCLCLQATRAIAVLRARAETNPPTHPIERNDDHSFEILQPRSEPPFGAPAAPPGGGSPLSVVVSFINPTVLVGARANASVTITNKSNAPEEQVALRVHFPPNVTPDLLAAEGPPGLPPPQMNGEFVTFQPMASLPPGETVRFVIPFSATQSGIVPITAQAASRNVRDDRASHALNLEIVGNRR